MAQLTDQLGAVNSGKPIVNPGPANPSVLELVSDVGKGALGAASSVVQENERRSARQRDEEERAARKAQEAALDDTVGGIFDIRRDVAAGAESALTAPLPQWLGGVSEGTPLPAGVMSRADELLRARRAVDQGRTSQASLDMRVENFVAEMYAKHPDSRYEIATAMKGLGIDHYMFRAEIQDREFADAGVDTQTKAVQTQFDFAASMGLVTNATPFLEGAAIGRQAMADQQRLEAAKAAAEAVRQDRTLSIQEQDALQKTATADAQGALMSQVATAIGPVIENTTIALSAAGTDAERQTILGDSRIRTTAALVAFENRAVQEILAAGGTPADVTAIKDFVKQQKDSLDALYTTSFEQNSVSVRNIGAAFNMTAAQAAPMYSRTVALIGQPAANALFGDATGVVNLDPQIVEQVKRELMNVDPTSERGTLSLARAIGYMRGQTGLRDLRADEAVPYIRANSVALSANTTALIGGNLSVLKPWQANYGNVAEAVVELAPATTSIASLYTATNQLASAEARTALDIAMREDPEYGAALVQSSRAASAHALKLAGGLPDPNARGWTIDYDENAGVYRPVITRENYRAFIAAEGRRQGAGTFNSSTQEWTYEQPNVMSYEEMQRNIPVSVQQKATTLTRSLTHLVQTDRYDEAIPRTLSIRERRDLYALGRTPASLRRSEGPAGLTQASEWETIRGNLDRSIQNLLVDTVSAPTPGQRAEAARVMNYEARDAGFAVVPDSVKTLGDASDFALEVNRAGVRSSAMGTYQIVGQTLRGRNNQNGYAEKVFGAGWRDVEWNAANQDKIAEAIFNDHNNSAAALRGQWVSLSLDEAERVRKMPWAEARRIIAAGESG